MIESKNNQEKSRTDLSEKEEDHKEKNNTKDKEENNVNNQMELEVITKDDFKKKETTIVVENSAMNDFIEHNDGIKNNQSDSSQIQSQLSHIRAIEIPNNPSSIINQENIKESTSNELKIITNVNKLEDVTSLSHESAGVSEKKENLIIKKGGKENIPFHESTKFQNDSKTEINHFEKEQIALNEKKYSTERNEIKYIDESSQSIPIDHPDPSEYNIKKDNKEDQFNESEYPPEYNCERYENFYDYNSQENNIEYNNDNSIYEETNYSSK